MADIYVLSSEIRHDVRAYTEGLGARFFPKLEMHALCKEICRKYGDQRRVGILHADDEEWVRDDFKSALYSAFESAEKAEITLDQFGSPEEAVENYRPERHDVVVTDLIFRGSRMNGFDLIKKIKKTEGGRQS